MKNTVKCLGLKLGLVLCLLAVVLAGGCCLFGWPCEDRHDEGRHEGGEHHGEGEHHEGEEHHH